MIEMFSYTPKLGIPMERDYEKQGSSRDYRICQIKAGKNVEAATVYTGCDRKTVAILYFEFNACTMIF